MIFITVGSQKFQFNRLLIKIDELIETEIIKDKVFAQIGVSDYKPSRYEHIDFLPRDEFSGYIDRCSVVITHGGTGVIIDAVKKGKKVIAIPRLAKYGEHVDDHQLQLLKQFENMGIISVCTEIDMLRDVYTNITQMQFGAYCSNTNAIVDSIDGFIRSAGIL